MLSVVEDQHYQERNSLCLTYFLLFSKSVYRYGGGPTLPRKAINTGFSQTDLAIEVYPLRLQLILMPKGEQAVIRISKKVCSYIFVQPFYENISVEFMQ
jgi:hypothetical protein